ncbi:MAG: hypothetical protein ABI641_16220 [Caldimonas sp.]
MRPHVGRVEALSSHRPAAPRRTTVYLIAIAWLYVVVLMAVVEAVSTTGGWLGALFTLLLYGIVPLGIVLYLFGAPARRRRLRAAEASSALVGGPDPDGSGHPPGDAVAAKREEA